MALNLPEWRGTGTLVTDTDGERRLWLERDDRVQDDFGPISIGLRQLDELLLVVGEWITCIAEEEGPIRFRDVHPALREQLYELVTGGIRLTDEDELELIS